MDLLGVDTGGTFTDFVYWEKGRWHVRKLPSTPENPSNAIIQGWKDLDVLGKLQVVHGTTVATNAILERRGARTALITNQGFEDLLYIGRQNRSELYNLFYSKADPLIPPDLCFGVKGRMDSGGNELEGLDLQHLSSVIDSLRQENVQAVAVCLLFSYLSPLHEETVAGYLHELQIPYSLSSRILPEFREFERLSTTVTNSYVTPGMYDYIDTINREIEKKSLRIMQSNGGSISAETAMQEPVRTILSGPAGGVIGAAEIGRAAGFDKLITFDMGGTSTDVCLVNESPQLSVQSEISGYPIKVPQLDIHTVGAGGGSIAGMDAGGSLGVGPESAGADPGPVCYGKGKKITVTDANLYLGRLSPHRFLDGNMNLQTEQVTRFMEDMAARAGISATELAEGILDVANSNMERALRVISVQKGFDPRDFALFSYGGAGGMHCAYLARMLSIPWVIVPENPGILSAVGMIMADVLKDYSRTVMIPDSNIDYTYISECFRLLEDQAMREMKTQGFTEDGIELDYLLDMRYQGQSFEIMVPFTENFREKFSQLHEQKYGRCYPHKPLEVVNIRLRSRGVPEKPKLMPSTEHEEKIPARAFLEDREVIFENKKYNTPFLDRNELLFGNKLSGPAVVVEYSSTVVIPPFASFYLDKFRNLVLNTG